MKRRYQEFSPRPPRSSESRRDQGFYGRPPRRQARALTSRDIGEIEDHIYRRSNSPYGDLLKFRLSVYAGLRAAEISATLLTDLMDPDGRVSDYVHVRSGKGGKSRKIPMHPKIAQAVRDVRRHHPDVPWAAFSMRWHTPRHQRVSAVTNYLWRIYKRLGLEDCSSHSGRRTFITNLAKLVGDGTFTLRDVQLVAGHARLDTTEQYIEPSARTRNLIRRLK